MVVVVYGFLSYYLIRYFNGKTIRSVFTLIPICIVLVTAVSSLYFKLVYPSDINAGFIFGAVWLTINIVLLEIYRVLPSISYSEQ